MTSGLPQSPAYAGPSPCAVGVLIAAGTLLLESRVVSHGENHMKANSERIPSYFLQW